MNTLIIHALFMNAQSTPRVIPLIAVGILLNTLLLSAQTSDDILWVKGGHKGTVVSATQSPDGRYVASAENGGRTVVWERNTGNQLRTIPHRARDFWVVITFLQDSRMIAATSGSEVFLYDALSGEEEGTITLPDTAIIALFPLPDTMLLAVHASGLVHLLDPSTKSILRSSRFPDTSIFAPRLIDNGSLLLYVDAEDTLKVWDRENEEILPFRSFLSYDRRFDGAAGAPVIAVTYDNRMIVQNIRTGEILSDVRLQEPGYAGSVALSTTGDTAVVGFSLDDYALVDSRSGRIFRYLPEGNVLHRINSPFVPFRSFHDVAMFDFSSSGDALLQRTLTNYGIFSSGFRFLLHRLDTGDSVNYVLHRTPVTSVAIRPDNAGAVTEPWNIFELSSGRLLAREDHITAFSRDGSTYASSSINDESSHSGHVSIRTIGGDSWTAWDHYDAIPWMQYVPPGGRYALLDRELYFADSTYHQRKKLPDSFFSRFAWDGDHLVTREAKQISIWDCRVLSIVSRINVDTLPTVVEFSKDNSQVAVGYRGGHIDIYETFSGNHRIRLEGHSGMVNDISFTRRDQFLVSAGADSTVRTWKLETGVNDYTYNWPAAQLSVSTSADGHYILSGGEDLTAVCWRGKGEISGVEELPAEWHNRLSASVHPNLLFGRQGSVECVVPQSGRLTMHIVGIDGRGFSMQETFVDAGLHTVELPVSTLASGRYYCLLRLEAADGSVCRASPLPLTIVR